MNSHFGPKPAKDEIKARSKPRGIEAQALTKKCDSTDPADLQQKQRKQNNETTNTNNERQTQNIKTKPKQRAYLALVTDTNKQKQRQPNQQTQQQKFIYVFIYWIPPSPRAPTPQNPPPGWGASALSPPVKINMSYPPKASSNKLRARERFRALPLLKVALFFCERADGIKIRTPASTTCKTKCIGLRSSIMPPY